MTTATAGPNTRARRGHRAQAHRHNHTTDITPDPSAADSPPGDPTTTTAPPQGVTASVEGSTDDRVRSALAAGHDLTVVRLADAAGLGKSTVAKALARLEAAGQAARTPGGRGNGTRQPDHWNAAAPSPSRRRSRSRDVGGTGPQTATPAPNGATKPAAAHQPDPAPAPANTGTGGTAGRNPKTGTARLAPGGLTALVADHFAKHAGVRLTSGEVGRALNRSAGAVRNACDKLVRDGALQLAEQTPRRYTTS